MQRSILIGVFLLLAATLHAQDKEKLFGTVDKKTAKKGFIICINGNVDFPGGDMAKRFGNSYRLGGGVLYKTERNWLFGAKCDFILGNDIRQDSLMINIRDKYSTQNNHLYEMININGQRIGVPVLERGYTIAAQFGKIIRISKLHPDNGIAVLGSLGFVQHKINIFDKDKTVAQLGGSYTKGYDRLTNGLSTELYAGYMFFARNGLTNFTLGMDVMCGFTQGRRSYLYDVMRPDNQQRIDLLFGLRGGWFIPIFRKKSEELLFE